MRPPCSTFAEGEVGERFVGRSPYQHFFGVPIMSLSRIVTLAAITAGVIVSTQPASAKTAIFEGITRHVSTNNIKVENPKTKQTLSFEILPKFNQVFSDDGKTTAQMDKIKAGQYVKIYFDQKFLGMRHADKILIMTSGDAVMRKE